MYASIRLIKQKTSRKHLAKQLQASLAVLNYPISVDGDFGGNTAKTVKQFQEENKLTADGIVGQSTWLCLYKKTAECLSRLTYPKALAEKEKDVYGTENTLFTEIKPDNSSEASVKWVQALQYLITDDAQVNGQYDKDTQDFVTDLQKECQIDADSCVDEATWQELFQKGLVTINQITTLFLNDDIIIQVAKEEDLDPAAIKAVIKVESRGTGFYEDKRPLILFEGHIFWRELDKVGIDPAKHRQGNDDILYPSWTKVHYTGRANGEYKRLEKAMKIHEDAALRSASWGMFQIMGFNHTPSGFPDVKSFVEHMSATEYEQIKAFIKFLHSENIYPYLKKKDWANFARRYNGAAYKKNGYDDKLQVAYDKNVGMNARGGDDQVDVLVQEYTNRYEQAHKDTMDDFH